MGGRKDVSRCRDASNTKIDRHHEELLVFDSINDGVVVIDRHFRIVSRNKAYLRIYNLSKEKVSGELCYGSSYKLEAPCPDPTCPTRQTFKTKESAKATHTRYTDQRIEVYTDIFSCSIIDEHGNVSQVVEIIRESRGIHALNKYLKWVVDFVAHELKAPLSAAVMTVAAVSDRVLSKEINEDEKGEMLLSASSSLKIMQDM